MIDGGRPILRNASPHCGTDCQIMRGFRLGFPFSRVKREWEKGVFAHSKTRVDHFTSELCRFSPRRRTGIASSRKKNAPKTGGRAPIARTEISLRSSAAARHAACADPGV